MKPELLKGCDQIVAAGANGVYQGMLLALVVWLSLRLCRRTNAATRHAVWFATLLLLVSLIPAHLLLGYLGPPPGNRWPGGSLAPPAEYSGAASAKRENVPAPERAAQRTTILAERSEAGSGTVSLPFGPEPGWENSTRDFAEFPGDPDAGNDSGQEALPASRLAAREDMRPSVSTANPSVAESPVNFGPGSGAAEFDARPARDRALGEGARFLRPIAWTVGGGNLLPRGVAFWVLGGCLGAGALRVALILWRLAQLRRLKTVARPAGDEIQELFQRVRAESGTRRAVDLRICSTERSPVLLGFAHPVILLPEVGGAATTEEVEHILRHELAHLARWDDWANLAQHLVQAAFFFHPAVYWISRRLSLEREIACDDCVLDQGSRPRTYALILANLAGRIRGVSPLLAPGVSTSKSQLQERITMILNTRRNTSPRLAKTRLGIITSAAVMAACLALYTAPRLVLAQSQASGGAGSAVSGSGSSSGGGGGSALSARPLGGEVAVAAGNDSPNPPGPDVGRGPKAKPGSDGEDGPPEAPAPPAAAVAPVPPVPPTPPVAVSAAPSLPAVAATPRAAVAAGVAYAPRAFAQASPDASPKRPKGPPALKPGATFEERLERLERMVESLVEHPTPKPGQPNPFAWKWAQPGATPKSWDAQPFEESVKRQAERATEQLNQALDQLKRAAEVKERAAKQGGAAAQEQKQRAEAMRTEAYQKQIDAVRKARESLQREMERLDRQLERLQRNKEELDGHEGNAELEKERLDEEEVTVSETADLEQPEPR